MSSCVLRGLDQGAGLYYLPGPNPRSPGAWYRGNARDIAVNALEWVKNTGREFVHSHPCEGNFAREGRELWVWM